MDDLSRWNIAISILITDVQELGMAATVCGAGLVDARSWENGDFIIVRDHDADGS